MTLEEMRARLREIEERMRTINAGAQERDFNAEEQTEWDSLDQEHARLSTESQEEETRVNEARQSEERAQRVRESRARWQSVQTGQNVDPWDTGDVRSLGPVAVRDRARKALEQTARDELFHLSDEQRSAVDKMIRRQDRNVNGAHIAQRLLITEHPDYRSAFMRAVTQPQPVLSPEESQAHRRFQEWRAMSIGEGDEGGFGVPVLIDPTIILTDQGTPNVIMDLARVETITTDEWKGVTSAGMSWRWANEATETTDGSPTLGQPTVPTHKADGFIPYSIEVGMDYPGFAGEMNRLLTEGFSEHLIQAFTVGTGSDQPTGIVVALAAATDPSATVVVSDAGVLAASDVYNLWAQLPVRFRMAASTAWMSSVELQNAIRQFGEEGGSDFSVNITQEAVPQLFGRRYPTNDYMSGLAASTSSTESMLIVGDWRHYLIAMRAGMNVELVPHVFGTTSIFPTGQRAWYAWGRVGANLLASNAFRLLRNAT